MGFGWNMAPFIFQTIVEALCKHVKEKYSIVMQGYIDDLVLPHTDAEVLERFMPLILKDFKNFGLQLNEAKCVLKP